jgi:FADH2 O2-dependent halogenase
VDTQVIIVGAGPVGLMLAGELRLGGAEVTVLERLAAPTNQSRASTLHARTMEAFDQRGLLESLGTPPNDGMGHFGGVPLDLSELPSRYPGQWKVPQTRVEELLAEWASGLGADIRRDHEVCSLTAANDRVKVEVAGPGGLASVTGEYLVGCDGEDSAVRRLASFDFPGTDAARELLRADVTGIEIPNRRFERFANGLAIASRRGDGVTRVMVHEFGRPAGGRTAEPGFAEVAEVWARVTGEDIGGGTPIWVNCFGDGSRQVSRYRQDRVLLAGDAAHRQMPVGGQALNLGLQDALNLGWKLAAQVTGDPPAGLLDTYHDERHPVGRRVLANIQAQTMLLLGGQEVEAARTVVGELLGHPIVRTHLGSMISGLDIRYGTGDHPLLGARMPHIGLVTESGPASTTALLRAARGVLLDLSADQSRRAWLDGATATSAGRVDLVSAVALPGAGVDGLDTVLLRPDGYVAWTGDRGADPRPALNRWFGARAKASITGRKTQESRQRYFEARDAVMPSNVKAANHNNNSGEVHPCDVLILGSGLAGSVSAAILARQGANVVLVDAASHPRFAIGESMTPQLIEWLHILSLRYDVPELKHLLDVKAVTRNIGPFHGKKQSFGFVTEHPGQEPDPAETTMFVIPKLLTEASHLFRQDTDAYYFHVAAKYGCTTRQNWRAADLDLDEDGVTVTGQNGEVFRARYLIDASGFRSPLAQKLDLREKPARFKHHSRSLFTHYIGVKPFDDVSHHPLSLRPPAPWNGGTLHHIIERGWFWIIPFNNHKDSLNPLCSVGLTFDERMYPKPADMTPDEEFSHYLDMYPAVKRQFSDATRVREWISTDRLQYSSKQSIGRRWCLMSHAAGFIDPLFSRGLSNTFEVVHALVGRILTALEDDDFSVERFEYVDRLERGLLQYNDDLVNSSYIAFSHFRLWNAVFRVWANFLTPGVMRLTRARLEFLVDHDARHFDKLEEAPHPGLWWPESTKFKNLLEATAETCEKYEVGEYTGDEAADIVFKLLKDCDLVNPVFGWNDENERMVLPTTVLMAKFMYWATRKAPPEMRELGRATLAGVARAGIRGKKVL